MIPKTIEYVKEWASKRAEDGRKSLYYPLDPITDLGRTRLFLQTELESDRFRV